MEGSLTAMDEIVVTIDMDWAPDFVTDSVADRLIQANVKTTWLVTHPSAAMTSLAKQSGLFDLGIPPNFLPASTQGQTPRDILRYCLAAVPKAKTMRTHSLAQSTPLLEMVMAHTPIRADLS